MPSTPTPEPSYRCEVDEAINTACSRQFDLLFSQLEDGVVQTIDSCRETLQDWTEDETLAIDLTLEDQLSLLEEHGPDHDLTLEPVDWDTLRIRIESLSASLIAMEGERRALEVFDEVADLLDDFDLPCTALLSANPYGCFRHYAERDEAPWHVYEYRNIEGEGIHIDLYEQDLYGIRIYVRHQLLPDSVSLEEDTWDAT